VALRGVRKSFGAARALDDVDFSVGTGEIHGLCGENGAGKSTLMGVLGGAIRPDSGLIALDGQPVTFHDPADALRRGIAVVYQELSLVPTLSVADNLALGTEPRRGPWLDRPRLRREGVALIEPFAEGLPPDMPVARLTTGQRQLVEIARSLGRQARVLVLDEPTAALSRIEADRLLDLLSDLRGRGLAIVLVSHHLDEVFRIADRITVLRDGRAVGTWPAAELTPSALMSAMVGEVVAARANHLSEPAATGAPALLDVREVSGRSVRAVSLAVRPGEIIGMTGLAGAGHEELSRILAGGDLPRTGTMTLAGASYQPRHPADALARGVAFVASDRRREGLIGTRDIATNVSLATLPRLAVAGVVRPRVLNRLASIAIDRFAVAATGPRQNVLTLSGGNQQKVVLARAALAEPRLLVLCDPTRGIDIRTREAVHRWIEDQAVRGTAIVLATSDTHELLRLATRLLVFRAGRIVRDLLRVQADEQCLLAAMMAGPA
jgi:ABC-type sugar transport system ATPase subunit